jgi:hypothetical protein
MVEAGGSFSVAIGLALEGAIEQPKSRPSRSPRRARKEATAS